MQGIFDANGVKFALALFLIIAILPFFISRVLLPILFLVFIFLAFREPIRAIYNSFKKREAAKKNEQDKMYKRYRDSKVIDAEVLEED